MSFILAFLEKIDNLFAPVRLPLDKDYSYAARHAEAERQRKAEYLHVQIESLRR